MAEDDVVYPLTGNDDLIAAGLRSEDDDDILEDAAALLGVGVGSDSAPIDLDGGGGEGAMRTRTTVDSTSTDAIDTTSTVVGNGKHKSKVWADFEQIYENVNGKKVCTKAICKICKNTLSARSKAGTGHLKRHQVSCRQKANRAARVQSRLAFNSDGSVHNWEYKPAVARFELCHLIARLDLPLGIGETQGLRRVHCSCS